MKRIIICGPCAAGKDFLKTRLKKKGYNVDVSYTTRLPREEEVNGVDYHFISEKEFMDDSMEFYEYVKHGEYYYGTGLDEWKNCDVFIMETEGIKSINSEDRKDCLILYLNPSKDVRFERLWVNGRNWSYGKISDRFEIDDEKFKDFTDFDIEISNPDF